MLVVPIKRSAIPVPQARSLSQLSMTWRFLETDVGGYKLCQSNPLSPLWTYAKIYPNSTPLNCRYLLSIQRKNARLRMLKPASHPEHDAIQSVGTLLTLHEEG